ncbi:leucyl/phenylalanyl-tRNA--protein transferase [Luteithermobacter gelatinilyticus]|uniref:leucyl/phenylalanyl-tRNA--protein transferase n=1 Tax=Luteithermobacter gelatinilyticus TaxID=2582913 RepID=UPI0011057624|nr:leucyl/phenylalanyl-tRNA--protein transferase [Luteithermobacter gelatinilyticus]
MTEISAELLLHAYSQGIFPMAEQADAEEIYWVDPQMRGIFPLDRFHVPAKLAKKIRKSPFEIRIDTAFPQVIRACAETIPGSERENTWINDHIICLYEDLFAMGYCHSVECWQQGTLVGGLYGVSIGGAFCGESMFHRVSDASKVALVYLVARLRYGGYSLLDTQFITPHLARFGAIEIPRQEYRKRLNEALNRAGDFYSLPLEVSPDTILQLVSQMS